MQGTAIQFASLTTLLWGLVATIQFYSLPVMALSIAGIGVALVASGDDIERKARLRHWIFNILIGGVLVFGAVTIANALKGFVGGS
jgi:hypothetical protein